MASSGGVFSTPDLVEKWYNGVQLYDAGEMQQSVQTFLQFLKVMQCSKMKFNIGCCYLIMNEVDLAAQNYEAAIEIDSHMAIGYFMNGLIYFLKNELDTSFEYFEKARTELRGNTHIDYAQLGLNYKLYACEILTNQASIMCKQNNKGKGKELLLLANSWKMEKKHDIISNSLDMLQAGSYCAMSIFMLPKDIIYRPSQKIINQLKKKDYLGKAKVLATENTEDIYACFSGLKAKDVQVPNHVLEKDVKTMLTDIKREEIKEKLKKTPPQKKLPELHLGRVINEAPKLPRGDKPILTGAVQNGLASKGGQICPSPPRRPPLPTGSSSRSSEKSDIKQVPTRPLPARISPPLTNYVVNYNERRATCPSSELPEKRKVPPPLPRIVNRQFNQDSGNPSIELLEKRKVLPPKPNKNNGHFDDDNSNKWQNKSPGKKVHEVEIYYTFTHKIKLRDGLSLREVQAIVEAQSVPDNIHMCTTDDNGKVQQLTEQTLENFLRSNSSKKEILCTTHDTRT